MAILTVKKDNSVQVEKDKAAMRIMQGSSTLQVQNAFAQLYKRYKEQIFFEVLKYVRMNRDIANDLTQEIFAKVYVGRMQYDYSFAVSTWIFKIAKNHIIDHKRREKFEVLSIETLKAQFGDNDDSSGSQETAFQIEDTSTDTFDYITKKERAEVIHMALGLIRSDETKKILELLFLEDMSYDKVAEQMNMPVGTIKAMMFRGKVELKKLLAKTSISKEYGSVMTTKHIFKNIEGHPIGQKK